MSTIKYAAGVRVHICIRSRVRSEVPEDWFPGRVIDAHVLAGHARYVVLLDDDRRLVAHDAEVRASPPSPWSEAAMAEVLDVAS